MARRSFNDSVCIPRFNRRRPTFSDLYNQILKCHYPHCTKQRKNFTLLSNRCSLLSNRTCRFLSWNDFESLNSMSCVPISLSRHTLYIYIHTDTRVTVIFSNLKVIQLFGTLPDVVYYLESSVIQTSHTQSNIT